MFFRQRFALVATCFFCFLTPVFSACTGQPPQVTAVVAVASPATSATPTEAVSRVSATPQPGEAASPTITATPPPTLTPAPTAQPANTPIATPTATPAPVTLAFVGDVMLGRSLGQYIEWGQLDYPFEHVGEVLRSAEFTIANLESALGDTGERVPKGYTFRAPPAAAGVLADAGIDLVSLANNHALDFGEVALEQGIGLLSDAGVATVGAGMNEAAARRPFVTTIHGISFGFLSYVHVPVEWRGFDTQTWQAIGDSPGLAWADPELISADVGQLASEVDHVIVLLHSGFEGVPEPSPPQIAASHAAVDAGASLVVGHHAHLLQGIEQRGEGVIFYGLGNFAFDFDEENLTPSVILQVTVSHDRTLAWAFVPVMVASNGQPRLALSAEAEAIFERLEYVNSFIGVGK